MTKKNEKGERLSRLTPKTKSERQAKAPELGIPIVSELQTRKPVIVAAGKTYVNKPD